MTAGHVDHGKTTLVAALTGKFADTHSEELKRGITIKLGYADVAFRKCVSCPEPQAFTVKEKCPACGGETRVTRVVSFVDAPGHETLMATVIAASSIVDGALFVIAANEKCPQPQTREHLAVLEASGVKNVVIVQNKIDLVLKEKAVEHYKQIKEFLKDSPFEHSPIIPVVANFGLNLDALIQAIETHIPTPQRDLNAAPKFLVARSFDVNKPGADYKKLVGGVVGGSIVRGKLTEGTEVTLSPGVLRQSKAREYYEPISTKIVALHAGGQHAKEAFPGGLIGVSTELDPALAKSDSLVGCVLGEKNSLPPVWSEIAIEVIPLKRVIETFPPTIAPTEPIVVGVGTATTIGFPSTGKKGVLHLTLKKPVCANKGDRVALMRRVNNRWRLYAAGKIV